MPTRRLRFVTAVAASLVLALPAVARAGDSAVFVVGGWGVGEIDGRIMFYLGEGRHVDTPIPAPPHGPRWEVVYHAAPWVILGASAIAAIRLYRRRNNLPQRSGSPTAARAAAGHVSIESGRTARRRAGSPASHSLNMRPGG